MKTQKNILIAFILNLSFAVFEFAGGFLTNSVAIFSDSIHDLGDAVSIGASYFFEKLSKKAPDENYTYGYGRFSVVGSIVTTVVLLAGSIIAIYNSVVRIFNPVEIDYTGMILFAVFGVIVNFAAAFFTREGDSINQKAVNLHMLEDVLGWVVVLIGAVLMKFTDISLIDSLMSIGVAVFILINAWKNLKEAVEIITEKKPDGISVDEIVHHISEIEGVEEVHHIHIHSLDGIHHYGSMHIVAQGNFEVIKKKIKQELNEFNVVHSVLELESINEHCNDVCCDTSKYESDCCEHHHHHHHNH